MSEDGPNYEHKELETSPEQDTPKESVSVKHEELAVQPAEVVQAEASNEREQAREIISQTAESGEQAKILNELKANEHKPADNLPAHKSAKQQKAEARRTIKSIRSSLPKSERVVSKVIHQPVVRVVSEVSAKTITRPSGLLGGSIVAFLGTTAYVFLAKDLSFRYNYLVFLLLFIVGFIVGIVLELGLGLVSGKKQKA